MARRAPHGAWDCMGWSPPLQGGNQTSPILVCSIKFKKQKTFGSSYPNEWVKHLPLFFCFFILAGEKAGATMIGIYKIENKINGKIYVGQSRNIDQRWYAHKNELNRNKHCNEYLQNSWNKYGEESFEFSVLEECTIDKLNDREIFWINKLYSNNHDYGYNLTDGGGGTSGHHWNDDEKEHLSETRNRDEIVQLNLDGTLVNTWRSSSCASRTLNIPVSGIRQCALSSGDQYQCHGYIWLSSETYYNDSFQIDEYIKKYLSPKKRIKQFDLYGNLIKIWNNTEEICHNFSKSDYKSVFRVLNHSVKSINGYIYLYDDDPLELTDDYLLQCRIDTYVYNIEQSSKNGEILKVWDRDELMNSNYKFNHIIVCCTKNRYHKKSNKSYSSQGYIWNYI